MQYFNYQSDENRSYKFERGSLEKLHSLKELRALFQLINFNEIGQNIEHRKYWVWSLCGYRLS